jgi:GAF domain-containing protein/HAMP domain-containing protein
MNQTVSSPPSNTQRIQQPGFRLPLSFKLPVIVIGSLIVSFLLFVYTGTQLAEQIIIDILSDELQEFAVSKAEVIESRLTTAKAVAIQLAAIAETEEDEVEEDEMVGFLKNTLSRNDFVFGVSYAYEPNQFESDLFYFAPYLSKNADNTLIYTDLGTAEYDYFNKEWYLLPKRQLTPVLSSPYFDFGGGNTWMVTWSVPFFDEDGNFKGVATADIEFSETQAIVNAIPVGEAESGEGGYAFLIDKNGIILGIGENGGKYDIMSDSMLIASYSEKSNGWIELVNSMKSGESGFVEATDPNGDAMLVAYAPVGLDTGWSLALSYPRRDLFFLVSRIQSSLTTFTIISVLFFGALQLFFTLSITNPLRDLREFAKRISEKDITSISSQLGAQINIHTRDELEDLGNAFNDMSSRLRESFDVLEEKVSQRTREQARLANELRTIAEVNRELSVIRDLNVLLNVSASLIRERLGYYHVGIFLVDQRGEYAILRGASSIAAEKMLASNYKLKVGETGLVGNVTRSGQAYIALDVGVDAIHFENPLLPDTRSEIALPLRSYNVTIGALDIQASFPNAFDEKDIQTLQVLADQLAAAIENAQLVQRLEGTLSELSRSNRAQTKNVWQTSVEQLSLPAYEYDGLQIRPIPQNLSPDLVSQLESGKPIVLQQKAEGTTSFKNILLVPLVVLGQVIGVIGLEQEDPEKVWNEDQIAIAQAAANRAALTLENARLLEESNRRANKERTIFEATSRIGSAVSMETILQTTAEELEKLLSNSEVTIQFSGDQSGKM